MIKKSLPILISFLLICCGPRMLMPPEIDLVPYERIGLISFSLENAKGQLDRMATQRFLQDITFSQRGAQIIELGTLDEVLGKINKKNLDPEAAAAIGQQYGVTSFFHGEISISDVKPQIDISALIQSMRIRAAFNISIAARFISTESGATLWTDSVFSKGTLAYLSMGKDQIPWFDIRDQDETYREFVDHMIHRLTRDFRPSRR